MLMWGGRLFLCGPTFKSRPGKIQPQERSQNFTSALAIRVKLQTLTFLETLEQYADFMSCIRRSCLVFVRSLKWTGWTGQIFLQSQYSKYFFIATTAKGVHISDGQQGPCGTDWNRKTVRHNAGRFIVAHIVKYLPITRFEWVVVK